MSRNDNRLVSWAQRSDRACCLGTSEGCLEEVAFELESRTGQRVGFVRGSQNGQIRIWDRGSGVRVFWTRPVWMGYRESAEALGGCTLRRMLFLRVWGPMRALSRGHPPSMWMDKVERDVGEMD